MTAFFCAALIPHRCSPSVLLETRGDVMRTLGVLDQAVYKADGSVGGVSLLEKMGRSGIPLSVLVLLVALTVVIPALTQDNGVVGKQEERLELKEQEKRNEQHIIQRSSKSGIQDEDSEIYFISRLLRKLKQEERAKAAEDIEEKEDEDEEEKEEEEDTVKVNTAKRVAVGGEKLILEALKGNVDPNSNVVNLLESMYVDDGSKHNQHPDGIMEIAAKKGKVYGDRHDSHRWTQEQLNEVQNAVGQKRNFYTGAPLWTDKIIPYTIHSSLSNTQYINVIDSAIKQFDDYTCLRWVPHGSTEDTASYNSYIEFFSESGCWSYVGRVFSDKQQISLQAPACVTLSTTIHEMAHAIGQQHEQSRTDRDDHVIMKWDNIQGGTGNINMQKFNTHDYNPYDLQSVLQYSLTAFTDGSGPTIVLKDPRLDFLADSATGLMFYDIQDITDAYDCTAPCRGPNGDQPLKECQNGGFVLHTCNCHCPEGLTGTLCETPVTDPACGGIINLSVDESMVITSPNFDNGGPYPTGKNCVWVIKVPADKFVGMTIDEMDLTTINGACSHWLEIQYNLIGQTGLRRCGQFSNETYYTSSYGIHSLMMLKFDTTFAAGASAGKGFRLTVQATGGGCQQVDCGQGTCIPTQDGHYACSCFSGFVGDHCDFYDGSADVSCTFENGNCMFRNSPSANFDWQRLSGATPSSGTGPSNAKTGQFYVYAETSSPVVNGDKFLLDSFDINAGPRCLTFWYDMLGGNVGSLNVLRNGTQLWTKSGNQGNVWQEAEVDIGTNDGTYKITFEAVRGSSWNGDIAIDDVTFTSYCGSATTTTTQAATTSTTQAATTTTTQAPLPTQGPSIFSCTFEPNTDCFLLDDVLSDDFDWTQKSGETPSSQTGPSEAAEGSFYSYIEVSGKSEGDKAIKESQPLPVSTGSVCLRFTYHMYGVNVGSLEVVYENVTHFHETGNKGDQWKNAAITLSNTDYTMDQKIRFIASRGNGFRGDIAIDNIEVSEGQCVLNCTDDPCANTQDCLLDPALGYRCECRSGLTGLDCNTVSGQVSSSFENGDIVLFDNSLLGDFDWTIRSGATPSSFTGPSAANDGLMYAYIEASGQQPGNIASLESTVNIPAGFVCLRFAYHMYGVNVGSLEVVYGNVTHFHEAGNKGDQWRKTAITLSSTDYTMNQKIAFIASRGNGFRGDIAIDNIEVSEGQCVLNCTDDPCANTQNCFPDPALGYRCECRSGLTGLDCNTVSGQVSSSFENGDIVLFDNSLLDDDFDWTIRSGATPSSSTGPSAANDGLMYAYIEASGQQPGSIASLESTVNIPAGSVCLRFAYHMYGVNVGSLEVVYGNVTHFHEAGNKGDQWKTASITLTNTDYTMDQKMTFIASRGNGFKGDIAIDNIEVAEGQCDGS